VEYINDVMPGKIRAAIEVDIVTTRGMGSFENASGSRGFLTLIAAADARSAAYSR
jgi:hypothetical protein